ncbi:PF11445 domain protein, partial [Bordetella bronchiseptica F4563]
AAPARPAYPELPLLDEFRQAWTRLSTDRQLRQSEQLVPENAGPLNSSHLAHRSLALMQGLSPGYLQQFLSYVDALGWLEQLTANAAPAARDTARATPRKTARARSR